MSQLELARTLAEKQDSKTGKWLLGRKGIHEKVPELSEWQVRKIIQEVRGEGRGTAQALTPTQRALVAKEAEQLSLPTITLKIPKLKLRKPLKTATETWVIASDFHAPYQHDKSCSILYQVIADIHPTRVVLLGDVINLDQFSRYDDGKFPGAPTWLDEIAVAGKIMGTIRQVAPDAKLQWFEGNHEYRLKKYLMRKDPALYSHLDIGALFRISGNDSALKEFSLYEYIDSPEMFEKDLGLVLKHGNKVRGHAGMSAAAEVSDLLFSVVMGHCHRLGVTRKSSGRTRYLEEPALFAMEVGCMCNYNLEYLEGVTTNWQHGFGILSIDRSGETPVIDPSVVAINNGRAIFRDKVYKA